MTTLRFTHTDRDGDRLDVRAGALGAIIDCPSEDGLVAVHYEYLPALSTVEELDALPAGSVVRSDAEIVYEKYADEDGTEFDYWLIPGEQRAQTATKVDLPATVLYEPQP